MDKTKDCIYREEATKFIDKCLNYEEKLQSVERETLIAVKKNLENIPAADVVEVVRCKDCKYAEHWYGDKFLCSLWNEQGRVSVFADGFCSYGERKVAVN